MMNRELKRRSQAFLFFNRASHVLVSMEPSVVGRLSSSRTATVSRFVSHLSEHTL